MNTYIHNLLKYAKLVSVGCGHVIEELPNGQTILIPTRDDPNFEYSGTEITYSYIDECQEF